MQHHIQHQTRGFAHVWQALHHLSYIPQLLGSVLQRKGSQPHVCQWVTRGLNRCKNFWKAGGQHWNQQGSRRGPSQRTNSTPSQPRTGFPATVLCRALPETDKWSKLKIAPKHRQMLTAKNTVFPVFYDTRMCLKALTRGWLIR